MSMCLKATSLSGHVLVTSLQLLRLLCHLVKHQSSTDEQLLSARA